MGQTCAHTVSGIWEALPSWSRWSFGENLQGPGLACGFAWETRPSPTTNGSWTLWKHTIGWLLVGCRSSTSIFLLDGKQTLEDPWELAFDYDGLQRRTESSSWVIFQEFKSYEQHKSSYLESATIDLLEFYCFWNPVTSHCHLSSQVQQPQSHAQYLGLTMDWGSLFEQSGIEGQFNVYYGKPATSTTRKTPAKNPQTPAKTRKHPQIRISRCLG